MGRAEVFAEGNLIPGTAYRVRGLIGRGGMGAVYEVEHAELGRIFVLKALHGHLTSRTDLVARMRNEWRALAKLNHPHIVQVTDAGQTQGGIPYFVMEHLKGQPLSVILSSEGRLGLRRACSLIVDVLEGLSAAHATGAIHRDVKPPNIFVTESGRAKLLDFGIAKLRDQVAKVVTAGGVSIGTPRFMAPEQAEGGKVDGRADIYAAGLVLYECVVGKGPFSEIKDPNKLVMAHIGIDAPRADHLDERVPAELGDLIHRWLSKSPASRPQTAGHAARELAALSKSFTDDPELSFSGEATVHAQYDSPTVGAPPSSQFTDRAHEIQDAEPESLHSPVASGKTLQTVTSSPLSGASPQPLAPIGVGKPTVAWGTPAISPLTQAPGSLRVKTSETPSPVSSPTTSSSPPPPSRPSLARLTAAACFVAFVVAAGVTLLGKGKQPEPLDPALIPSAPVASAPVASTPVSPSPPSPPPREEPKLANSDFFEQELSEPAAVQPSRGSSVPIKSQVRSDSAPVPQVDSVPAVVRDRQTKTPGPADRAELAVEGEKTSAPPRPSGTSLPGSGL